MYITSPRPSPKGRGKGAFPVAFPKGGEKFKIQVLVVSQPHYSVVRGLASIEAVGTRYALEMEPSSREGCSRTSVLSNLRTPDEVKEAELPKLQLTIKNDRER